MNPQLQQGFFYLIYWTWLHNADALAFLVGAVFCLAWSVWRPNRLAIIWFIGFSLLLLRFEYIKHIVEPLFSQTVSTVVREGSHVKVNRLFDVLLFDLVPLGLYLTGWGSMIMGMVLAMKHVGRATKAAHH